ncbi:hypothetical protein HAX54_026632 [Datura stramonium]|uniref:Uncharacterized protein n=1 Tax=Datura stramonium TaxID=4076 RepID=A0ABS8V3E7_DATST|nr:hypothetical protein [Datura stramonium]
MITPVEPNRRLRVIDAHYSLESAGAFAVKESSRTCSINRGQPRLPLTKYRRNLSLFDLSNKRLIVAITSSIAGNKSNNTGVVATSLQFVTTTSIFVLIFVKQMLKL